MEKTKHSEVIPYHLYLGAKIKYADDERFFTLDSMNLRDAEREHAKLVLRKLDSMTEEEMIEVATLAGYKNVSKVEFVRDGIIQEINFVHVLGTKHTKAHGWLSFDHCTPAVFKWLLEKRFWLFGDDAFEKGLIIDSSLSTKPEIIE